MPYFQGKGKKKIRLRKDKLSKSMKEAIDNYAEQELSKKNKTTEKKAKKVIDSLKRKKNKENKTSGDASPDLVKKLVQKGIVK